MVYTTILSVSWDYVIGGTFDLANKGKYHELRIRSWCTQILTNHERCVYGLHHNLEQIVGSNSMNMSYES